MKFITRRKAIALARPAGASSLKPTLSWPHLVALGIGAIVGTGIYTLTGVAAGLAGPAVIVSFAVAGLVCSAAALCYAEMASLAPQAGSAYTYAYISLGELLAWIVGWSLILEYTLVCSAVAVGWGGYASGLIEHAGWPVAKAWGMGQSARHVHHRGRHGHTAAGHTGERDAQRRPRHHQDHRAGGLRRPDPAKL